MWRSLRSTDPDRPDEPFDFELIDREALGAPIEIDVSFDFEGVALWYICWRDGDAFKAKKILVQVRDGRFVHGQVGDFDGFGMNSRNMSPKTSGSARRS